MPSRSTVGNRALLLEAWENRGTGTAADGGACPLARIIHDSSSRNCAVAMRDRRAEPRGREAYLKQYVDRLSGEPACLDAGLTASRLVEAANSRLQ